MDNQKFWSDFIEMYRQHTCLWDVKSNEYLNKHKRATSYELLLEKLKEIRTDATLELLKKKINNMRTAFRRELKRVQDSKRTGAAGDIYEPTLWYYDLLLFTAQSETGRKGQSSDEQEEVMGDITVDTIDETEFEESADAPLTSPESGLQMQAILETEETRTSTTSRSSSQSSFRSQQRYKPGPKAKTQKYCVDQKKRDILNLAHNALRNNDEDEYCIAGRRLGYQLKGLQDQQRFIAEKLISDVMFYARMGKLTEDAVVHCKSENSSSSSIQIPITSLPQSTNLRSQMINQQLQQYELLQTPLTLTTPQSVSNFVEHVSSNSSQGSNVRQYFHSYQEHD